MPGSFDLNPTIGDISNLAPHIHTLYNPGSQPTALPNVICERIDERLNDHGAPEPPVAHFRYATDTALALSMGWPDQYEELWPIDAQGDYVVQTDDRLIVSSVNADGNPTVLFDGFAQIPQVSVAGRQQAVSFGATGVAVRLWDTPIKYRFQRDGDNLSDTSGDSDRKVYLPCRFNPASTAIGDTGGYLDNCIPSDQLTMDSSSANLGQYPVFLDPLLVERTRRP